jgi:uncharacterized membrane protein (UPF0127 family)
MEKKIILIIFLLFVTSCTTPKNSVCFENNCFEVELAVTEEERAVGLMHREYLDQDKGMLFIFEEPGEYGFWMKNTLIPLDIVWIDENKEVIFIGKDIRSCKQEPCPSINPRKPTKFVLELNADTADKIGLEKGDKLEFNLEGTSLESPISLNIR